MRRHEIPWSFTGFLSYWKISNHNYKKLTGALLLFALAGALAAFFPPGIGSRAVEGAEVTKPFWPFLWIYAIENNFGMWGMIFAPVVIFGFLFVVPLIDRPKGDRPRSKVVTAAGVIMVTLYVGLIIYGAIAPQQQHMMDM